MRRHLSAIIVLLGLTTAAHADTTYNFLGPNFTRGDGVYTTNDFVSGSFTVADPLGANLVDATITPPTFSFSDGEQTISSANAYFSQFRNIYTDADGNLTQYIINTEQQFSDHGFGYLDIELIPTSRGAIGYSDVGSFGSAEVDLPGTFTKSTSTSVTPEPSSLILLGTGLVGAVTMARRRWSAQQTIRF